LLQTLALVLALDQLQGWQLCPLQPCLLLALWSSWWLGLPARKWQKLELQPCAALQLMLRAGLSACLQSQPWWEPSLAMLLLQRCAELPRELCATLQLGLMRRLA
jgi:hypothetical protein